MLSLVMGVALLGWIVWPMLRKLPATVGGRGFLALCAWIGTAAFITRIAQLEPGSLAWIAVVYFGAGGVLFAWERWRDGAAARLVRAKAAQLAPQRMRRPLPPAPPPPTPVAAPTSHTQRGTP